MLDFNSSNRLNIDDFVRIITEFKLTLSITDIQMLFHTYELYKNGLFFYEEMFKDLKKIYHNDKRYDYLEKFYNNISEIWKIQLRLMDLKNLFEAQNHKNVLSNEISVKEAREEFNEMIDSFEFIMRLNGRESYISLQTFEEFFKYFGFSIDEDNEFFNTVNSLFNVRKLNQRETETRSVTSKKSKENIDIKIKAEYFKKVNEDKDTKKVESNEELIYQNSRLNSQHSQPQISKENYLYQKNKENNNFNNVPTHKNYEANPTERRKTEITENSNNNASNQSVYGSNTHVITEEFTILSILEKLKVNLKNFGRKSLLSLIKHFKCYDNGTKFVNKYDFIKVIRDFRLNLTASEIEKLFEFYLTDKRKMLINFEEFINIICNPLNETRKNILLKVFDDILVLGKDQQNLELEILKSVYNPSGNLFGKDSDQVYTEFIECIELYHFNYKRKRNSFITLEEFLEFYRYIGFLVESDVQFVNLITNEYSKLKEVKEKFDNENIEKKKKLAEEEKRIEENRRIIATEKAEKENKLEAMNEFTESRSSFYKEKENYRNNDFNNRKVNEHTSVSGDILRKKLENLNNNNNYDNCRDEENNQRIISKHKNGTNTPLRNHERENNLTENKCEIEKTQNNFNRNNKFTKEMKEKALKSEQNLVNYVVNKNFKSNIDKVDALSQNNPIDNGVHKFNELNTNKNNVCSGTRTPISNMEYKHSEVNSVYKTHQNKSQIDIKNIREQLVEKLKKRGLRGLMNLHKQFLISCQNLNSISLNDFSKILKLQRLDFTKEEFEKLFDRFKTHGTSASSEPAFLNFPGFIRSFKNVLNEKRLEAIETAFGVLDEDKTEMLFLDDIKFKFNAKKHPDAISKKSNEEEILLEFIDCFDLNYTYLSRNQESEDESNFISFQEFANFYEYVSFLYERDDEFIHMIDSVWNLN